MSYSDYKDKIFTTGTLPLNVASFVLFRFRRQILPICSPILKFCSLPYLDFEDEILQFGTQPLSFASPPLKFCYFLPYSDFKDEIKQYGTQPLSFSTVCLIRTSKTKISRKISLHVMIDSVLTMSSRKLTTNQLSRQIAFSFIVDLFELRVSPSTSKDTYSPTFSFLKPEVKTDQNLKEIENIRRNH